MEVLQISFDGLEDKDKNIFLLIACFFKGSGHKDFLPSILEKIDLPRISVGNLSDNDKDYVTSILKKCSFNPIIGIRNLGDKSLLSIKDNKIWVHDLLEEMGWKILEKKSLTEKLGREIKLWNVSNVSYVLKNCTHLPKLRSVRLFGCINLTEIFNDFTLVPNLEVLDLGHCRKLSKIDPSIQFLGKLIHLDLRGCISLENLPPSLRGMVSLKILYLGGCHTLRDLPKDIVCLKSLELLNIQDTAITHVPIAILKNLRELFFDRSSRFHEWHHPGSFAALDYKRLSRRRSI
ncbi:disease resistance protein RPV1-like [Ziziphus jujuba]|uniref:Disease resistance protein RPV1-like n=1 Tax=Ziziphus jujuba TaxID=326968 RepID=A0ABM4A421_ZIZJJ|nr:disease resistance protein RPV1-like [Ziziphus jujuba]